MAKRILYYTVLALSLTACKNQTGEEPTPTMKTENTPKKEVVYHVFTRLFGNTNTTNKPWGTLEENGVGKFNDFTTKALKSIKDLGATYVWYTGVPHHAVITDYTEFGISNDDPDVVKGRAGSPYAVKDYYQVDPDMAENPAKRLQEFEALIKRTHKNGLKVIIDIVPNHVARKYESLNTPKGSFAFGAKDNDTVSYSKDNNFYYIPGEDFKVPQWQNGYEPLGGGESLLADGKLDESPAKWTGNGSRAAQPNQNDWYETVKINYGINPDGHKDFDELPTDSGHWSFEQHADFWKDKDVPASWKQFKDIALFWTKKGIDGFRFDMAEMVPVEFWSYMNSAIKMKNPDAFLMAEVYNPSLYRDYIFKGKMDYLYDKVELYDTIKHVMQGHGSTDHFAPIIEHQQDIEINMLHFLENHDEQRIASPDFAGNAEKGKPAMVVSALISKSPVMIYFGQELGEPAEADLGFGDPTRTSIFDYGSVPSVVRWVNNKKFDGGKSTDYELELRDFYKRLLNFSLENSAVMREYADIHWHNRQNTEWYNDRVHSFVRWCETDKLIVVTNFDANDTFGFELQVPQHIIETWGLVDGDYDVLDQLYENQTGSLKIENGLGKIRVDIKPLESFVYKLN
ncbi:alpha-amylase family protein [Leeuwenhoekiella marinoflava]|uniref:Glycosidase n=2 Tax=Leeuwenhoekiella marinoflava TaxID=988 RepID=A0A4Q0PQ34_9FLAO|nr:glycosidase [Leeuwenhoekiella marinoflava]SHE66013.1 Glycosidase [Leeuwenhoekiella marinoflava DSM 3653]